MEKIARQELSNLYFSPSIIRIVAPRRSIWERHRREVHAKFDRKTSRDHYEDIDIGCMIILKMLKRQDGWIWMGSSGSEYEQIQGSCGHGNEPMDIYKIMANSLVKGQLLLPFLSFRVSYQNVYTLFSNAYYTTSHRTPFYFIVLIISGEQHNLLSSSLRSSFFGFQLFHPS